MGSRRRPPTDFELLKEIYERHHAQYLRVAATGEIGRVMLPLHIPAIATALGSDPDTVFGRLYYHLDLKYGESAPPEGSTRKRLFYKNEIPAKPNCVNFPLLEAVLAGLWEERDRNRWTFRISVVSVAISIVALIVSIVFAAT